MLVKNHRLNVKKKVPSVYTKKYRNLKKINENILIFI